MNSSSTFKSILYLFSFGILVSYFLGFYLDENSVGGGGYNGDLSWILKNINIFKENKITDAILHKDLFGNRTPLIYVLNTYLNPFFFEVENYRRSVFILSLLGPVILFFTLKLKFKDTDLSIILLLSLIILLSPFYRTSAYWSLNENYGIITFIASFLTLNLFIFQPEHRRIKKYFYLFLTITISSLTVYFDQKFILAPIIIFLTIFFKSKEIKIKIFTIVLYLIYSLPFLYLVFRWGGIVPPSTQAANPNTITSIGRITDLYLNHIGYASTMIAIYLLPLLFFFREKTFFLKKKNFLIKNFQLTILLPLVYIFFIYVFYDFNLYTGKDYWIGFGFIHKLSIIFFDNLLLREFFTYISFLISWMIISLYLEKNFQDYLIVLYFFTLSILLWPLMQEYFDPAVLLVSLLVFKTKLKLNYNNTLFLALYFTMFLIGSNLYYQ